MDAFGRPGPVPGRSDVRRLPMIPDGGVGQPGVDRWHGSYFCKVRSLQETRAVQITTLVRRAPATSSAGPTPWVAGTWLPGRQSARGNKRRWDHGC